MPTYHGREDTVSSIIRHGESDAPERLALINLANAAPDLLSALKLAFTALGLAGGNMADFPGEFSPQIRIAWLTARAEIARAEGRTA